MDQLMILRYAYRAALADWDQARVALERNPRSAIQKKREAEADKAFNEDYHFTKIKVPKYLFLLSKNVSSFINFSLTLCVFLIFCLLDGIAITPIFLLLIYPIVAVAIFNIGLGLILSAFYVFFRDMQYLWTVFAQLLMYASAIFYTTDGFSHRLQAALHLNPVYLCITYFRQIVLSGAVPGLWFHLMMLLYGLLVLGIGCLIYKKYNHKFLYYL